MGREGGKKRLVRKTLVSVAIPLEGRDFKFANLSDQKNNDITDRQQGGEENFSSQRTELEVMAQCSSGRQRWVGCLGDAEETLAQVRVGARRMNELSRGRVERHRVWGLSQDGGTRQSADETGPASSII